MTVAGTKLGTPVGGIVIYVLGIVSFLSAGEYALWDGLLWILISLVWLSRDFRNVKAASGRMVGNRTLGVWIVFFVVLWIVAVPVYLVQRSKLT